MSSFCKFKVTVTDNEKAIDIPTDQKIASFKFLMRCKDPDRKYDGLIRGLANDSSDQTVLRSKLPHLPDMVAVYAGGTGVQDKPNTTVSFLFSLDRTNVHACVVGTVLLGGGVFKYQGRSTLYRT